MKRMHRVIIAIAMMIMSLGAGPVSAQEWPTRFVALIVPFGAGSASDIVSRILTPRISEALGQQVIIENVGGAGGNIGVTRAAKAVPDGYTVVMGALDTFAQSPSLFKTPPYNPVADFTPVGLALEQPLVLTVRKDMPVANLQEFASYVKANQTKVKFASSGVGSAVHLACSQIINSIGATVTHVPYRSSAPALQDMIAGHIDFYCPIAVAAIPLIANRSIKALAILTKERSPLLPDLGTAKEQGFEGLDGYYWMGFFFPKGTPDFVVKKFNEAVSAALDSPEVQTRLRELGTTIVSSDRRSPAYLRLYVQSEIAKWGATIKASGITPQ